MQLLNALPRQPFLGLALAGSAGILVADCAPNQSWPPVVAVAIFALIALVTCNWCAVYAVVASGFFLLHSFNRTDSPGLRFARDLDQNPYPVTVRGTVISEPKISGKGSASFLLQAKSIEIDDVSQRCDAKFFARWNHDVQFGDEVKIFGTAERIDGPRNPSEFDMRSFLARQDVHRALIVRYPENGLILNRAGGNPILRAAQISRDWMRTALSRDLEDSPAVSGSINGMILGIRHQTEEDIEEPFQQTGTLHLFAVAGLHVGIMARLLWIVATVIRLPRSVGTLLIVPGLLFYAAVTGLHTASVRAAVMSGVLLTGFLVERRAFALNNLAAAATLILCWDTNELFSVGFQLSFSVVAAILLLSEPSFRFLRGRLDADPFLPRKLFSLRRRLVNHFTIWLARASSVSFAAWVGSLPLMVWYYYLVTPISLLANLVVVPIAFFVLAGGLVSMVVAPFSTWLSLVFNNMNWLLTKIILGAVYFFAQIPAGHLYVERPHWPNGAKLEITALDLKSGAALHIRTKESDWLCDTGSARDYERVVRQYLRSRGVNRLDGLIVTHGDGGHIGGGSALLLDFRPRRLIDAATQDRSPIRRKFIAELPNNGKLRQACAADDAFDLSRDVKAKVLFPSRGFESKKSDDQALVIQLVISDRARVLIMSDGGVATEQSLLTKYPELRSDIIVKGQHYSGNSGSDAFLDRVQPDAIIATSRDFPEYERIKDEWVERVEARGIKLFRQDITGAVRIRVFDDHWEAHSFVTSETFRRTSR